VDGALETVVKELKPLLMVPLIQGTLSNFYSIDIFSDKRSRTLGATYAFVAAVVPLVYNCSVPNGNMIYKDAHHPNEGVASFEVVKGALERQYECLGVTCEQIGGLVDIVDGGYLRNAEPCGLSATKAPKPSNPTPNTPSTNNQTPTNPNTNNQTPSKPSTNNQTPSSPSNNNQTPNNQGLGVDEDTDFYGDIGDKRSVFMVLIISLCSLMAVVGIFVCRRYCERRKYAKELTTSNEEPSLDDVEPDALQAPADEEPDKKLNPIT